MNPVLEVEKNFLELSPQLEFDIRLKSLSGIYGFIEAERVSEIIIGESAVLLEKCWKEKQKVKDNIKNLQKYYEDSVTYKEKVKKRMKKENKSMLQSKSLTLISENKNNANRMEMLSKCATPSTTYRSLTVPKKPISKTSQSWSTKSKKKYEMHKTEINFE